MKQGNNAKNMEKVQIMTDSINIILKKGSYAKHAHNNSHITAQSTSKHLNGIILQGHYFTFLLQIFFVSLVGLQCMIETFSGHIHMISRRQSKATSPFSPAR